MTETKTAARTKVVHGVTKVVGREGEPVAETVGPARPDAFPAVATAVAVAEADPAKNGFALVGMKAICRVMNRSESTVLMLIKCEGLPARKIGGQWESDVKLLQEWRQARIKGAPVEELEGMRRKMEGRK